MTKLQDAKDLAAEVREYCKCVDWDEDYILARIRDAVAWRDAWWAAERDRLAARLESANDAVTSLQNELRSAFAETEVVKARLAEVEQERDWHIAHSKMFARAAEALEEINARDGFCDKYAADVCPRCIAARALEAWKQALAGGTITMQVTREQFEALLKMGAK